MGPRPHHKAIEFAEANHAVGRIGASGVQQKISQVETIHKQKPSRNPIEKIENQ